MNRDTIDDADLYTAFYHIDPRPIVGFLRRWIGTEPLRALDVGCGPGRLLAELLICGWQVSGLDPNPSFCKAAGETGAHVSCGSFSDIDELDEFDVICAVNDPFQYQLSFDTRLEAVARLHRALCPGGHLLIDISNFHWILAHLQKPEPRTVRYHEHEITRRTRYEIDFHNCIWTHIDDFDITDSAGNRSNCQHIHRLAMIGLPEVQWMLRTKGFENIQTWPSFAAHVSGRIEGPRIIFTCRKPQGIYHTHYNGVDRR